jgi:hypothetical protein
MKRERKGAACHVAVAIFGVGGIEGVSEEEGGVKAFAPLLVAHA